MELSFRPVGKYDTPAEAEWMGARRTTHPQGCFTGPVFLSQPPESFPFTRTYIKTTQAPENDIGNEAFWRAARHAKGSPAWRYYEIATNHMVSKQQARRVSPHTLRRRLDAGHRCRLGTPYGQKLKS